MRTDPGPPAFDLPTVAALGLVAAVVRVVVHEGAHALACPLVGGVTCRPSRRCTSRAWRDLAAAKVVDGVAPTLDLVLGASLWVWLRAGGPQSPALRLTTYLFTLLSWLAGSGYLMVSGIVGIGDVATVLQDWSPAWAWRVAVATVGSGLFLGGVWGALHLLGPLLGGRADEPRERVGRAQRLGVTVYVAAVAVTLAAALVSPLGPGSLPSVAGLAAALFGYSPLLWMAFWFADRGFAKPAAPALTIERDPRWWAVGVVAAIAFVAVLGPTLTFG